MLYAPKDDRTRPMMERVRGALFSMLLPHGHAAQTFEEGSRWLDLYSGTARARDLARLAGSACLLAACVGQELT